MQTLIILMAILYMGTVSASDLNILKGPSHQLNLEASDCQKLLTQHRALCDWKKSISPDFIIPEIKESMCVKSGKGFKMTISSCLPDLPGHYQNEKLQHDGANCWGTAMSLHGYSDTPRFVWAEEMLYWLDSPVCRKLAPNEEARPGDMLMIFGPEYISKNFGVDPSGAKLWDSLFPGRLTPSSIKNGYTGFHFLMHAETFISSELTFGKDSPNKDAVFKFNKMDNVYANPMDHCRMNQAKAPYLREYNHPELSNMGSCSNFSVVYRCDNFQTYFDALDLTPDEKEILKEVRVLMKEQEKLFPLLVKKNFKVSKAEKVRLLQLADKSAAETLTNLAQHSANKNTELLLVFKYFTSVGIRRSIELGAQ